jgi:hypothetical protein
METKSLNGSIYFAMFIDNYSKFTAVYFLKRKIDVFSMFQSYKALIEIQIKTKSKVWDLTIEVNIYLIILLSLVKTMT